MIQNPGNNQFDNDKFCQKVNYVQEKDVLLSFV